MTETIDEALVALKRTGVDVEGIIIRSMERYRRLCCIAGIKPDIDGAERNYREVMALLAEVKE